jgi:GntR family transcriptional regulator
MFFSIDPSNGVAIYEQIVRQVAFAVASEALATGELVPSVRELARELAVNPNTVARAYRDLQSDGVLAPVRGTGLAVAPGALKHCKLLRKRIVRDRIASALAEAKQSGVGPESLRALIDEELAKLG